MLYEDLSWEAVGYTGSLICRVTGPDEREVTFKTQTAAVVALELTFPLLKHVYHREGFELG